MHSIFNIMPKNPAQKPRVLTHCPRLFLALATVVFLGAAQLACDEATSDQTGENTTPRKKTANGTDPNKPAPRASLSFGYIHELEDIPEGGPVSLTTTDGADLEITGAYLVVSGIEVHLCESARRQPRKPDDSSSAAHFSAPSRALSKATNWLLPEAFAHVPSSATRLGTPFVEDLLEPGRARIIDEIAPPVARYCTLFAIISPADDDVVNLSGLDRDEIEGKSLLLIGRWRPDQDSQWRDFRSTSTARDVVEIKAEDPKNGATPLVLTAEDNSRMMLLDKRISPELFAGLTAEMLQNSSNDAPDRGDAAANHVLEALKKRLKLYQFDE